jgi:LPXTG-motif cell wall-anchored protein
MSKRAVVRRAGIVVTGVLILTWAASAALASDAPVPVGAGEVTTTTILAEGPTEPEDSGTTTTEILGPDSPMLPDTGAGHSLALAAGGLVLMSIGAGAVVIAAGRLRRARAWLSNG